LILSLSGHLVKKKDIQVLTNKDMKIDDWNSSTNDDYGIGD